MSIENFKKYLNVETFINESRVYYAPPLRSALLEIRDNPFDIEDSKYYNDNSRKIAADLLDMEGDDVKGCDITFINLSDDVGYFTHNTMKTVIKKFKDHSISYDVNNKSDIAGSDDIYKSENELKLLSGLYYGNKNKAKIGRVINALLKYNKYNTHDIENFVNKLKSLQSFKNINIEIVSGDDINYWYDKKNYLKSDGCVLANSCMSEKKFFNLYTKNKTCRLVIIKNDDNKLLARALLWELNSCIDLSTKMDVPIKFYMDRIYYTNDYEKDIMKRFAAKNGWAIYDQQYTTLFKNKYLNLEMTVKVNQIRYKSFPYMDTFSRLDVKHWLLYNDRLYDKKNSLILGELDGKYFSTDKSYIKMFKDFFIRY